MVRAIPSQIGPYLHDRYIAFLWLNHRSRYTRCSKSGCDNDVKEAVTPTYTIKAYSHIKVAAHHQAARTRIRVAAHLQTARKHIHPAVALQRKKRSSMDSYDAMYIDDDYDRNATGVDDVMEDKDWYFGI